jgi:hypothetical protein
MLERIKKYLPKSLFGRSLLILVLPIFLAQAISVYIFYERHWDSVSRNMASSLAGELALIAEQVQENPKMDLSVFEDNLSIDSISVGKFPQHRGEGWKRISTAEHSENLDDKTTKHFKIYRSSDDKLLLNRIKLKDDLSIIVTFNNQSAFGVTTQSFCVGLNKDF